VQNGDQYFGSWFWSDSLDVMVLASHFFIDKREMMQDFKLKTVCGHAGINIDESKLHDAIYDVKLTRELFLIVTK
jgi:DNA polymerase-3 subunit epsilon